MICPVLYVPQEVQMKPPKLQQEIRKMRFEEAYYGWAERRLTRGEAARLL